MNIKINTQDETIFEAIELAKKYYAHPDFLLTVSRTRYNMCEMYGWTLANTIKDRMGRLNVEVGIYRPWNPFSKVIAYAKGGKVFFNTRKNFPLMDRLETCYHEFSHLCEMKHRGNSNTEFNRGTFPYLAAKQFRAFVEMQEKRKEVA